MLRNDKTSSGREKECAGSAKDICSDAGLNGATATHRGDKTKIRKEEASHSPGVHKSSEAHLKCITTKVTINDSTQKTENTNMKNKLQNPHNLHATLCNPLATLQPLSKQRNRTL